MSDIVLETPSVNQENPALRRLSTLRPATPSSSPSPSRSVSSESASGQALAGVVGPLIEVPVLVGLVYVSPWARRFFTEDAPSRSDTTGV